MGIICTLDLFPVPESVLPDTLTTPVSYGEDFEHEQDECPSKQFTFFPLRPLSSSESSDGFGSPYSIPRQIILCHVPPYPLEDVVFQLGNHMVTESSKLTPALVGEKFVEPLLVEYKGRKALMFVFSVSSYPSSRGTRRC